MTKNKNSTRYYSNKQEQTLARILNASRVSNSGATRFGAGDVKSKGILFECKTCVTHKKSFSIKKEWLEKNKEEAFAMGKDYAVLAFNFGPGQKNYYILDEKAFLAVKEILDDGI